MVVEIDHLKVIEYLQSYFAFLETLLWEKAVPVRDKYSISFDLGKKGSNSFSFSRTLVCK